MFRRILGKGKRVPPSPHVFFERIVSNRLEIKSET